MAHRSARLTMHGRTVLVRRVLAGRPVAHVAAELESRERPATSGGPATAAKGPPG